MFHLRSFNRFILIGLALLGLSVSSVNAAIVDIVDNGGYTTDTLSGLDWLDATSSTLRSHADVAGEFGVGGDFEGWRHATIAEVETFFVNAGAATPFTPGDQGLDNPWVDNLVDLWGATVFQSPFGDQVRAITGTESPGGSTLYATLFAGRFGPLGNPSPDFVSFSSHISKGNQSANFGHALVRASVSAVPVPAAVWLFGTALIGFVGMSRRRKVA